MNATGSMTGNPAGSPAFNTTSPAPPPPDQGDEFSRFANLTRKLVRVSKTELDEKRKDES